MAAVDTRAFKRNLHHSERYNRRGFGLGEEVAGSLQTAYQSDLIGRLRTDGHELREGRLTVRLAEAFGFCWGVERAVAMAYETRRHYPSERIWITNEIIHNPSVNDHLREMDVAFIPVDAGVKDFSEVACGDVRRFAPGDAADPRYGELFRTALAAGMEVLPCIYSYAADQVIWQGVAAVETAQPAP